MMGRLCAVVVNDHLRGYDNLTALKRDPRLAISGWPERLLSEGDDGAMLPVAELKQRETIERNEHKVVEQYYLFNDGTEVSVASKRYRRYTYTVTSFGMLVLTDAVMGRASWEPFDKPVVRVVDEWVQEDGPHPQDIVFTWDVAKRMVGL